MSTEITQKKTPAKAWAVLAVVYFASFTAPVIQMKVPALASWLFPAFMMDATTFGLLMSALSIVAFLLAFPVAFLIRRFGLKAMMVVSLVSLALGASVGALAAPTPTAGNLTVFFIGRFLEGIGLGCIGVVGPSCLSVWFPDKTRGLALGIWATWIPVASVVTLNVAPRIAVAADGDWRIAYWIAAALAVLALILFVVVFKMPDASESDTSQLEGTPSDAVRVLKNPHIWMLGVVFFIFNGILVGVVSSYFNTFIEQCLGFDPEQAGSIASLQMAFPIVCAPVAGAISDRLAIGKKKYLMAFCMAMLFVAVLFLFTVGPNAIIHMWVYIVLGGILGGACAGACRPMAPVVMERSALGATMGMAVLQFMQNLGQAVYAPVFGSLLDATGNWQMSAWTLFLPTIVVAFVLCFFVTTKKSVEKMEPQN